MTVRGTAGELFGTARGQTLYVLGDGPSLPAKPPDDWQRGRCIGTNRIYLTAHRPRIVMVQDRDVLHQQITNYLSCADILVLGPELTNSRSPETTRLFGCPRIRALSFQKQRVAPGSWARGGPQAFAREGYLTGYYAADLACRMVWPEGRVVLAGMDLEWPTDPRAPTHAYGYGAEHGASATRFPEAVDAMVRLWDAVRGKIDIRVHGHSALLARGIPPV